MDRNSFLRLKRFRVEELRSRLKALEGMKLGLDANMLELEGALERERLRCSDSVIARLAMPNIRQTIEFRQKNIERTCADLERDRLVLEADLAAALQDLQAAETAELERRRRALKSAEAISDFQSEQRFMRRHLRRHAVR